MAKILVADDNSNVQKTVALALADLSVEVVAVNNGEAAVRKLPDIAPDLILADIFMPVRNGYEVCEFVKKDARFAQVPVVLLVGAFDPLDEREAQRVGADGILKKPFVPPDPLIAMVKNLLDRTLGDRLVAVGVSKPAVSMQQNKSGGVAAVEDRGSGSSTPEAAEELPMEEFRPPVERLSFGEGERPIAFEQLLETPAQGSPASGTESAEPVADDQVLTNSRDASLGDPIFWKAEEPESEAEEENPESEEDISSETPVRAWKPDEEAASRSEADFLHPVEPFELVRDEKDEEAGQNSTIVESSPLIAQDAASQASLTVQAGKAEDLAANPIEWMASVPPPPAEEVQEPAADWNQALSESAERIDATEIDHLESAEEPVSLESPAAVTPPILASTSAAPVPPSMPPAAAPIEQPQAKIPNQAPDPRKTQPSLKPSGQSAEDTARSIPKQEWADLAASLSPKPNDPVAEKPKPAAPLVAQTPSVPAADSQPVPASVAQPPAASAANDLPASANSALPPSPDPALVEAVVQRVLEKMRPQVVDIITKEFLRPVVQALVHREITKR